MITKVNTGRALLGGLVATLIINLIEWVVNGVVLKAEWTAAMQALGKSGEITGGAIAIYNIGGLLEGIIGVWLYSALISRYGAGSTTAAKAGLVTWVLVSAIPNLMLVPSDIVPSRLMTYGVMTDFIAILLGVTMGALLYREDSGASTQAARA